MKGGEKMARRGAAAGFWMIQRQKETGFDPYNPYDLPVFQVGRAALFYSPAASLTFSLYLTDTLFVNVSLSAMLTGAVALNMTRICGGGGE